MFLLLFLTMASAARVPSTKKIKPQMEMDEWDTGEVAWNIPDIAQHEEWIQCPPKITPVEIKYNELSRRMMDSLTTQAITSGVENAMSTELLNMRSLTADFNEFITHLYSDMSETDWIFLMIASFIGIKIQSISQKKQKKIEQRSSSFETERYLKIKKKVTLICIVILSIFTKNIKSVT